MTMTCTYESNDMIEITSTISFKYVDDDVSTLTFEYLYIYNENEYIKINDTEYYPCNYYIKNCKQCKNKDSCILCDENYSFLNNDNTKC